MDRPTSSYTPWLSVVPAPLINLNHTGVAEPPIVDLQLSGRSHRMFRLKLESQRLRARLPTTLLLVLLLALLRGVSNVRSE